MLRMASPRSHRRIGVVVADDHPLFREGLERAVRGRPELELLWAAGEGREALERIRVLAPDVAVLDVRLPGLDGFEVLNALVRDGSGTRVVFLSATAEQELVYRAVQAGARGYFRKETDREAILDGINAVAHGRTALDPELQAGVLEQIRLRRPSRTVRC